MRNIIDLTQASIPAINVAKDEFEDYVKVTLGGSYGHNTVELRLCEEDAHELANCLSMRGYGYD